MNWYSIIKTSKPIVDSLRFDQKKYIDIGHDFDEPSIADSWYLREVTG